MNLKRLFSIPLAPHNRKTMSDANIAAEEWEKFLRRKPLILDRAQAEASLSGKRILITGAGGWIGSALTRAVAALAPEHLVLLEAAERNLYEIDKALQQMPRRVGQTPVLGSVTQPALLEEIFRRHQPEIVFHAAAFKHVPLMEQNPFAAVENNAIGTHLLAQAAAAHKTPQLILVSTDKAVDPVSVMGASKRIAELILLANRITVTRMKAVRLGNVLGSEGSVVPLFRRQIQQGGPVTVTHPKARRYFLTTEDAVTLLLGASSAAGQGILVPELGEPVSMESLAWHLIAQSHAGIVFTQLRPGDKLCEALLSDRETYLAHAGPLRAVESPGLAPAILDDILEQLQLACRERSLDRLLTAVLRAVPEYRPSTLMHEAVPSSRATV
jgi:FlaA1/EpsC-like NDP-sugar epimerase